MFLFISILLFGLSHPSDTRAHLAKNYIHEYRQIAVVEMYRSGIPASITLAQALHESNLGTSDLATYANNHFGIKCKTYWTGGTYYHKDDDTDRSGRLIESCFRSYSTVIDSYVDHSNFLQNSENYSELFQLRRDDYKSWAYGLKKAGYATDPMYALKLIAIVEKYDLARYDSDANPLRMVRTITR